MCICIYTLCLHTYMHHIPCNIKQCIFPSPFLPLSSTFQPHKIIVEKENLHYQDAWKMSLQDPRLSPFWWSQKGSLFWGDGGHTFFLFRIPLSHPNNQPASSPCWKRPGSTPAPPNLAFPGVINTITRTREKRSGDPTLQPTQAQSLHPEHIQRFMLTHTLQWGVLVCLKTMLRDSSYRNIGLPGCSSLSPLPQPLL